MIIALSVAHASWHPHRSGYPSAMIPDEYGTSRLIVELLAPMLRAAGHDVDVVEKTGACGGSCGGGRCSRYSAAVVNATAATRRADLAVEFHIDHRAPGNDGAIALVSDSDDADKWAGAWLSEFAATTPIRIAGGGVYRGADVKRLFGRKWFLVGGCPHAAIIELGNVASATDSAYLSTTAAIRAAAAAAVVATRRASEARA